MNAVQEADARSKTFRTFTAAFVCLATFLFALGFMGILTAPPFMPLRTSVGEHTMILGANRTEYFMLCPIFSDSILIDTSQYPRDRNVTIFLWFSDLNEMMSDIEGLVLPMPTIEVQFDRSVYVTIYGLNLTEACETVLLHNFQSLNIPGNGHVVMSVSAASADEFAVKMAIFYDEYQESPPDKLSFALLIFGALASYLAILCWGAARRMTLWRNEK